jgi:hypothetical protein
MMANQYLPPVIQIPSSLQIIAISQSSPMIIAVAIANPTTEANTYQEGMNVKLTVPNTFGMYQANNLIGTILAVSGSNFTLNINSSQFDPFSVPSGNVLQPATIAPYGSKNLQYNNSTDQVPFQSLNNQGN